MDNKHVYALVTGATRGIGYSIVSKLLESGARVVGTAFKTDFPKEFLETGRFVGIHADFSDIADVEANIRSLFSDEKAPNVVINNAGIAENILFDVSDDDWKTHWDRTITVNLTVPVLISKWALNRWAKEQDGILINVSSRAAYRGDTEPYAAYAASKGGLVAFTKTVARGFGKDRIAAYSITPGFIDTDMARNAISVYGLEYIKKDIVLPELTPPEEVGELVNWLASGKVKHLTGASFHINGGSYMI